MSDKDKFEALARMIAAEMKQSPQKPKLRLITGDDFDSRPSRGMDPITRESHLRVIRQLRKAFRGFGFELIIAQATIGKTGVEALDDDALIALHRDLDRARECINEGVTFEDAGLVRSGSVNW